MERVAHTSVSAERFILSREFFGMKLGLENITEFLTSIGSPQERYRTIHIAGTNGKGSTAAMLAAILRAEGYRTGLFTSPHLVRFTERVRVNGRMISGRSVASFVDRYRKELVRRKLSFFEVVAALAMYYFERAGVEVAVIETGLGGRLDATNVLRPELTITTDISRDHLEILGSSLRKIAVEKAGIIKPGVPHLVGLVDDKVMRIFSDRCRKLGSPCYRLRPKRISMQPEKRRFEYTVSKGGKLVLRPSLYGLHQMKNGALAVEAALLLNRNGLSVTRRAIKEGISSTRWAGRFQVIESRLKPTLVLDVCHNPSGTEAFVQSFKLRFPGRKAYVIAGFVKRKEHQKIFDLLTEIAESFALVPLKTKRSVDLVELAARINWRGRPFRRYGSLGSAWSHLLKKCCTDDIIVVVGSHYLVGEFLQRQRIQW